MGRFRSLVSVFAGALALAGLSGCTLEHWTTVDFPSVATDAMAGGRHFEPKGYVHAEAWTPAFFYVFPLMPSMNAQTAQENALAVARNVLGADTLTDVKVEVDTHMWFFWIMGWREAHVSATAISTK